MKNAFESYKRLKNAMEENKDKINVKKKELRRS
jgi:hypothetical protein